MTKSETQLAYEAANEFEGNRNRTTVKTAIEAFRALEALRQAADFSDIKASIAAEIAKIDSGAYNSRRGVR